MLTKERGVAENAPALPATMTVAVTVRLTVKPLDDFDQAKLKAFVQEAVNEQMLYGAPDGSELLQVEYTMEGRP